MLKKSSANKVDKEAEKNAENSSGKRSNDQYNNENGSDRGGENAKKSRKEGGGWNALKDDFMMNSKLKDWDKELSDEDDDDDSDGMDGGGFNEARDQDADALMEDDNWSD